MKWYLRVLKKYAVFSGRASRTEYWMFFLFNIIAAFLLGLIGGLLTAAAHTDQSVLIRIYQLAVLIPSLAVGWRRMQDTDRSGWWLFAPIIGFVFLVSEGTKGNNRFGPNPWGSSQD